MRGSDPGRPRRLPAPQSRSQHPFAILLVLLCLLPVLARAGTLSFQPVSYATNEGAGSIAIGISYQSDIRDIGSCTVSGDLYTDSGSTATQGADYTFAGGFTLQLVTAADSNQVGNASTTVQMNLVDDTAFEGTESAGLGMTNISSNCNFPVSWDGGFAHVSIADNDTAPTTSVEIVSGNGQSASTGDTLAPFVLRATSNGQPVAGLSVSWSVSPAGAGTLSNGASTTTDASGESSNTLTVSQSGSIQVSAQISGYGQVSFVVAQDLGDRSGLTPGQRSVARVLDTACAALSSMSASQRTSAQQELLDTCDTVRQSSNLGEALNALAPDEVATQATAGLEAGNRTLQNLRGRLYQLRQGYRFFTLAGLSVDVQGQQLPAQALQTALDGKLGGAAGDGDDDFSRLGVFVNGSLSFGNKDGTLSEPGFDFSTKGVTLGADYRFRPNLISGAALSYRRSDSDLDNNSGTMDVDGWALSLYGTFYQEDLFYLDGTLTYGLNSYTTDRSLTGLGLSQIASSDTDGRELSLSLGGGFQIRRDSLNLGPYARLTHDRLDVDGYREHLGGPAGAGSGLLLAINDQEIRSTTLVLGSQFSWTLSTDRGVFLPQINLEWAHEFQNDSRFINGHFLSDPTRTAFALPTDPADRNYFNLGLGASATFAEGRSGFIYYETVLGRQNITNHAVTAGVRLEF